MSLYPLFTPSVSLAYAILFLVYRGQLSAMSQSVRLPPSAYPPPLPSLCHPILCLSLPAPHTYAIVCAAYPFPIPCLYHSIPCLSRRASFPTSIYPLA